MDCRGLEGYRYNKGAAVQVDREGRWLEGRINTANLKEAQRIWNLVDADYCPIDWHLDFKSGYRWLEDTDSPETQAWIAAPSPIRRNASPRSRAPHTKGTLN